MPYTHPLVSSFTYGLVNYDGTNFEQITYDMTSHAMCGTFTLQFTDISTEPAYAVDSIDSSSDPNAGTYTINTLTNCEEVTVTGKVRV